MDPLRLVQFYGIIVDVSVTIKDTRPEGLTLNVEAASTLASIRCNHEMVEPNMQLKTDTTVLEWPVRQTWHTLSSQK